MNGSRIEEIFDGTLRPVHSAPPVLLSSERDWCGFLLERDLGRDGRARSIFHSHTSLVLVDAGSIEVEEHALGRPWRFLARRGSVTLWPAGYEARAITWRVAPAATEMVRVQMNLSALRRLMPDDDRLVRRALAPQGGADDVELASMMRVMAAEIAAACPAGRLFAESLSLALAVHVAQRYGGGCVTQRVPGGLARGQLERVCEYIGTRLDGGLSLVELAAVVGVSPRHFAAAFRRSVGVTPHQYVLARRIDRAKTLLIEQNTPVAELAMALGFSSQSHFTQVFRRFVGATPRRYQQR